MSRHDSGIFNPPESAAVADKFEFSDDSWVANGPTPELPPGHCPECGGAGVHVYGDGGGEGGRATETGWSATCPVCWGEGRTWEPIPGLPPESAANVGESSNSGDGWVAGGRVDETSGHRPLEMRSLGISEPSKGAIAGHGPEKTGTIPCGRCHRSTVTPPYDSCPDCVARLAKSLAEEMRKVRALEATLKATRETRVPQFVGAVRS